MRMSRAGRKELMLKALQRHERKFRRGCLITSKLAHAAGLKSSTEVVKMLREMAENGLITEVQIELTYGAGYTQRAWQLARWEQQHLPDIYIVINGKQYRRDNGEEIEYVRV